MSDLEYEFDAVMWRATGDSWYFVTVPIDMSGHISSFGADQKTSYGSIRVKAEIGQTEWKTSLFPDKKSGCYFLPIKADIRKREKLTTEVALHVKISVDV